MEAGGMKESKSPKPSAEAMAPASASGSATASVTPKASVKGSATQASTSAAAAAPQSQPKAISKGESAAAENKVQSAPLTSAVVTSVGIDSERPSKPDGFGSRRARDTMIGVDDELTTERLRKFQRQFNEIDADGGGSISIDEFRNALRKTVGNHVTNEEADMLFMKVDTNCDGVIDWEEYLTYVLLECRERDMMRLMAREPYIPEPRFCRADNRDVIVSLHFLPSQTGGRFLSASKDGLLTFWTKNFKSPSTQRVMKGVVGTTPIWVTAVEVALEPRLIIVATTNCDMTWYFYGTKTLERISRIHQLPGCILCMSFYSESHYQGPNRIFYLSWGDEFGGVGLIIFSYNPLRTDIANPNQTAEEKKKKIPRRTRYFFFTDISNGVIPGLGARYRSGIHAKYVRQIRYIHKMRCWLSCSKDSSTAFFVGDLIHLPLTRPQYWPVEHGVNTFDYCEKLNVIVTGGFDSIVRLWNPLAESKLVGFLKGHISPITHLLVNHKQELLVTLGENKDIIVFDLNTTTVVQKLVRKTFRSMGIRPFQAALLQPQTQDLVVATKTAAVLTSRTAENLLSSIVAKDQLITVVLYNTLFKQVVTGDQLSQVSVYDIFSGQKIMQFVVHTLFERGRTVEVEITAMTFDSSLRRLATGTIDGIIKIWNFNNGTLLQQLTTPDKTEITCLAWPPTRILAGGWGKRVTVYLEVAGNTEFRCLKPEHAEDILCLGVYPPRLAISASEDGSVMVWSLETSYPMFMFSTLFPAEIASANFYESVSSKLPGEAGRLSDPGKGYRISSARQSERLYWSKGSRPQSRKAAGKDPTTKAATAEVPPPPVAKPSTTVAVEVLIVLTCRDITDDTAVLLTCLTNGHVLAWPLNIKSRCVGDFFGASAEGESINCASVTEDNEFLVIGDSAGYLKVFDISHYRCGSHGPQCDADTDALRQPLWNDFPFVRMRRITDQLKLSKRRNIPLHLSCKCTETDKGPSELISDNPPHLVNCLYAHMGSLVGVQIAQVYGRLIMISAATDFSIRLWSIFGEFLGIFGQRDPWRNIRSLPKTKKLSDLGSQVSIASDRPDSTTQPEPVHPVRRKAKIGLPNDLRRVASYTTMYILETEADTRKKSRWGSVRHAAAWICTFLANRDYPTGKVFELPAGSAEKAAPFSSNLREMIEEYERGHNVHAGKIRHMKQLMRAQASADKDALLLRPLPPQTSSILGKSYQKPTHHRAMQKLTLDESIGGEISPYRSLPYPKVEEEPTVKILDNPALVDIRDNHYLPPIDPNIGLNLEKKPSDPTLQLMTALKRAGWNMGVEGQLRRQRLPINGPFRKSMLLIPSLKLTSDEELSKQSISARKSGYLPGVKRSM